MAKKIVFIEEAYSDIYNIGEYYLEFSELLKQKFEKDLFSTIEPIAVLPISYHIYKKIYRSIRLSVFPFNVYYKEDLDFIIIVAVIHSKRSNSFRNKRLK